MARQSKIEEQAEALLTPIAERFGVRVYDVDYSKEGPDYYLRLYIDKDGGVNIGDCENVSRAMSDALDEHDFIQDAYTLEVSSPGLGRTLTKDRHFAQSIGEKVEGTTYKPFDGKNKSFDGILQAFTEESVTIADETGKEMILPRKDIAKIRLQIEL